MVIVLIILKIKTLNSKENLLMAMEPSLFMTKINNIFQNANIKTESNVKESVSNMIVMDQLQRKNL